MLHLYFLPTCILSHGNNLSSQFNMFSNVSIFNLSICVFLRINFFDTFYLSLYKITKNPNINVESQHSLQNYLLISSLWPRKHYSRKIPGDCHHSLGYFNKVFFSISYTLYVLFIMLSCLLPFNCIFIFSLCLYLSFGCCFWSYLCKAHWIASV